MKLTYHRDKTNLWQMNSAAHGLQIWTVTINQFWQREPEEFEFANEKELMENRLLET